MTERLAYICRHIPRARVFADIGCDHGYCTQYVLERGLCERAYVSDVSAECLEKAKTLLQNEIAAGRCIPVCADGLEGIPEAADCVLCAGLGGEEMVRILSLRPLPEHFVLQPMKNTEKVRRFLVARGAKLELDVTFPEGKQCYDLLVGRGTGGDVYSEHEYRYGRDNLKSPGRAFCERVRRDVNRTRGALARVKNIMQREALLARLAELEGIQDAIEERL